MSALTRRRRAMLAAMVLALLVAAAEVGSAVAIWFLSPRFDEPIRRTPALYADQSAAIRTTYFSAQRRMLSFDPQLGWVYARVDTDTAPSINRAGLRGAREYPQRRAQGMTRVAAFGDSFVYGNEVTWPDSWPALMEHADSSLEMLNYGVGGYGVDQSFLRFQREGRALSPQLVLIGFTTDDLRRVVNVYRRFIGTGEPPLVKPRFKLGEGGELHLLASPVSAVEEFRQLLDDPHGVRAFGADDQWYEPLIYKNPLYDWSATARLGTTAWLRVANRYLRRDRMYKNNEFNTEAPAFHLQLALFRAFHDSVKASGMVPAVVLLPDRSSVLARAAGGRTIYAPLADSLTSMRIPFVDAIDGFVANLPGGSVERWFMPGGHYSREGNLIVAQWLAKQIPSLLSR